MRAWFIVLALYPSPKHIKRSAPRGFYTDPTLISEALWVISPSVRHSFSFNQPNVFFFFCACDDINIVVNDVTVHLSEIF